jgi:BirA family transcriptional regulator, biotin operon repressor / biotin---[acetyl-CoA-carboxylase] ligase
MTTERDADMTEAEDVASRSVIDADFPSQWFDLEDLVAKTLCEAVVFRRECSSTNDLALALAPNADGVPLLVVTDCQTGGRGRGGNTWWAREGALTFSVLLDPSCFGIDSSSWPLVSLTTAIAVADTLGEFCSTSVGLKWPNDVHLAGKKVCGILVEPARGVEDRLIIGVGVNVLNSLENAPSDIRDLATSIIDETGDEYSPGEFLLSLLGHLGDVLATLGAGQLDIKARWARQCVLTGRQISLESGDHLVGGRCAGVETTGAILVESEGETKAWFGGVVRAT